MFSGGTVHGNRSSRGSIPSNSLESDPIPPLPLDFGRETRALGRCTGLIRWRQRRRRASRKLGFGRKRGGSELASSEKSGAGGVEWWSRCEFGSPRRTRRRLVRGVGWGIGEAVDARRRKVNWARGRSEQPRRPCATCLFFFFFIFFFFSFFFNIFFLYIIYVHNSSK
jgi:hypothetical protein